MTQVLFYTVKRGDFKDDVIAVFPFEVYNRNEPWLFSSYQHEGQHGPCHIDFIRQDCRKAKPDEYADLLKELCLIGYKDLVVKQKIQWRMMDKWREQV